MILSFLRVTSALLAVMVLLTILALPVQGSQMEEGEITVREDGQLLRQTLLSTAAGLGAAVCLAAVFIIVWKEWEL